MYKEDERDVAILKVVLPLMSRHAAGYHPISYSVWYEYAKEERAALRAGVDEILRSGARLTPESTYALYSRYLVEPAEQALMSARSGLLDLVARVRHAVQGANADTAAFDDQLNSFQRDLASASTLEDLSGPVASMLAQTQRVHAGIGKLSSHLEQSQDEVRRLTDELHRLREEALVDALSGLLNRRGFDRDFAQFAARTAQGLEELAVIMLDIDHFKRVNDTYGHALGDAVIAAVGKVIRETVGAAGRAARYGGEEFAVLLPGVSAEQARRLAEGIRQGVEQGRIRRRSGEEGIGGVTLSAGVACAAAGDDPNDLVEVADRALYQSKKDGRNRVTCATG